MSKEVKIELCENLSSNLIKPFYQVCFVGGNNGHSCWPEYLEQVKDILAIDYDNITFINMDYDCEDDIWHLECTVESEDVMQKIKEKYKRSEQ